MSAMMCLAMASGNAPPGPFPPRCAIADHPGQAGTGCRHPHPCAPGAKPPPHAGHRPPPPRAWSWQRSVRPPAHPFPSQGRADAPPGPHDAPGAAPPGCR
jgi:hypothetical protein